MRHSPPVATASTRLEPRDLPVGGGLPNYPAVSKNPLENGAFLSSGNQAWPSVDPGGTLRRPAAGRGTMGFAIADLNRRWQRGRIPFQIDESAFPPGSANRQAV